MHFLFYKCTKKNNNMFSFHNSIFLTHIHNIIWKNLPPTYLYHVYHLIPASSYSYILQNVAYGNIFLCVNVQLCNDMQMYLIYIFICYILYTCVVHTYIYTEILVLYRVVPCTFGGFGHIYEQIRPLK